jgi:membrane protease YdiL (CAAX protease family)
MHEASKTTERWSTRRQITVFLVLAAVLSWWPWPLTLLNPASTPLVPVGPSIGAVVVTAVACGRRGVAALLRQLVRWRVHPGWYAVALVGPVGMIGVPVLVNLALGAPVEAPSFPGWAMLPILFAVRTLVGGALGEELGWRGFLLPRLLPRFGPLVASLLIAPVWFVFHLPVLLAGPATAQRPPLLFFAWIVPLSVLLTWLYLRTGRSVLLVTLFHGAVDTVGSLLFPLFTGAAYLQLWLLVVAATTAWAAALVRLDPVLRPVPR